MSNTISIRELATEARRLAEMFPDRTAICTYTRYVDDELVPNCIVGRAAYNLGVSLDDLNLYNACGIRYLTTIERPEWLEYDAAEDNVHMQWLSYLQGAQDGGVGWGEALHRADRRLVMNQFDI